LYFILSGTFPFLTFQKETTIENIVFKQPNFSHKSWTRVSAQARDLVSRMLEKRREERITVELIL
jgi:hypothetical protein